MGPAEIIARRLHALQEDRNSWKRRHRWLGNARLAGAGLGLCVLWAAETYAPQLTWHLLAALVGAYLLTGRIFSKFEEALDYVGHAMVLYQAPVAGKKRKEVTGEIVLSSELEEGHPFGRDLDILEPGGLVDYLNIGSSQDGIARLASLVTEPTSKQVIAERQAVVKELRSNLDLREEFYVAGSIKVPLIRTQLMRDWAAQDPVQAPRWLAIACLAFSVATVVAAGFALAMPSVPANISLGACLLAEFALWKASRRYLTAKVMDAERIHRDFYTLRELVRILERQDFHAPILRALTASLKSEGRPASEVIGRFCQLIGMFEARRNQIVAIVGPLVLYTTQLALAMERWRAQHAANLPDWIDAIGRFEAFSSLSCFAFEHPLYAFPRLVESGPLIRAESLAHPLLPDDAVENDVSLDRRRPILVVSGANMAGKSTLLRSIGINVALTYAGAPVRARTLTISPMNAIASISVQDSLLEGMSRFAAELSRLRLMLTSIRNGTPTLVLIDELFAGTNSFDRFAGAVALSEFLLGCETSLAVLSTHDRNVTRWAEQNSARISNVHFRDVFDQGRMTFDYRLHPGPALRGNAVELMKQAGLPISETLPNPLRLERS